MSFANFLVVQTGGGGAACLLAYFNFASSIDQNSDFYEKKNQKNQKGKLRLQKWYITLSSKEKAKIVKDLTQLALARRARMCNFLEYKGVCLGNDFYYGCTIAYSVECREEGKVITPLSSS